MNEKLALEKVPPQNIEAEMAVLGAMLLEEDAIAKSIEILNVDNFYRDAHRYIFKAILELYENGKAADIVTISEKLRREGNLEKSGGVAYISSLLSVVPTASNVEHYASIVREKALLRKLITTATDIVTKGYEDSKDVDVLMDKAEQMIFDIAEKKIGESFYSMKHIIKDSFETIEGLYQGKTPVTGLSTGLVDFDVQTAGLQPSDLIIVAGRPSSGKTALALTIASHVGIEMKVPVALFSLEMSKEQLVRRFLCSEARVDAHKLRTGYLKDTDWPKLTRAAERLSEALIFIDDSPILTPLELRAKARRLKSREKIGLIIVDYLQLMHCQGRVESRQQEISQISRSLKALARQLTVPVVALSQLSRAVESREGHRPQLSDLRESGAIEQDGDVISFLYREELYNHTPENDGVAELIIGKQRNGPVGAMKLTFLKEFTRFENYSPRADAEAEPEND
ncbi:MAG: replicative DNA helicase [Candidatus Omnitrophica bacterium]|nr:replicative DNA helicase [Candidatus Omnitrophota bacterium]